MYRGLTLPESEIKGIQYIIEDTQIAKKSFANGDNLNFNEMLNQEHDRIEKIINNYSSKVTVETFQPKMFNMMSMCEINNKDLYEQVTELLRSILVLIEDSIQENTKAIVK